jgi:hypothetical protein
MEAPAMTKPFTCNVQCGLDQEYRLIGGYIRIKQVSRVLWVLATLSVFVAPAPLFAQDTSDQVCPKGYSPLLGFCTDETGDVVLPVGKN